MNEPFALLHDLSELASEIGRVAAGRVSRAAWIIMRRLTIATRMAIAWPFVLLLVALPSSPMWPVRYLIPTLTIVVFIALMWMMTAPMPMSIFAMEAMLSPKTRFIGEFVSRARQATNVLRIVLVIELLLGLYFAWIPIANNRPLALTQIIILAAIACAAGIKKLKLVVVGLAILFGGITLLFFLYTPFSDTKGAHTNPIVINFNFDRRVEAKTDEQSQKPAAETPAIPDPLASARSKAKDPAADTGSPKKIEEPVKSPRQTDSSSQEGLEEKGSGVAEGQVVPQTTPAPTPDPNAAPVQVAAVVGDLDIVVQNCVHRLNKFITCDAIFTSVEGNPKELAMKEGGAATDNESNVVPLPLNWITSDLGWNVVLKHGDSAKFGIKFKDDSFGESNRIMIKFHLRWNGDYGDIEMPQSVRVS